jgi:hypothetical protein
MVREMVSGTSRLVICVEPLAFFRNSADFPGTSTVEFRPGKRRWNVRLLSVGWDEFGIIIDRDLVAGLAWRDRFGDLCPLGAAFDETIISAPM